MNSSPEDERWFPPQVARMSPDNAERFLAMWDRIVQKGYAMLLEKAPDFGPYKAVISLGDNTSGNNEMGMVSPKARAQWRVFRERLEKAFPLLPKLFVWGGHDVGYLYQQKKGLPAIGLQKTTGMTKKSFESACELLGEPWQKLEIGEVTLLLLNSEIIRTSRESRSTEIKEFATEMVRRQNLFVEEILGTARNVVLMIHDPRQLRNFESIFVPHLRKIRLTLAGQFHLRTVGGLYRLKNRFFRQIRLRVIPSSFGLAFLFGKYGWGGFGVLNIFENMKLQLRYHYL